MFDLAAITTIAAVFLLAGAVKGVIGLGLPTVSLGLLTAAFDLTTAMALLIVPSLLTNIWQACSGGNGRDLLSRVWPFLLAATVSVWIGAAALTRVDLSILSALLGALLMAYAIVGLVGVRPRISHKQERWAGPTLGAVNGILTGMTGSFVVPGVVYLQALGLDRDQLVQAMGMLFTVSTIALAFALQGNHLMTVHLGAASAAAVFPAMAGMFIGQKIRFRLSERGFRRTFYVAVMILGAYIFSNGLFNW
jgi:hypothetical protein